MRLGINNVTLLDSINFLPMGLAKLPAAFSIPNVAKGWFPYFFNRSDVDWNYAGPYPPMEDYGANEISPQMREKFLAWYKEQEGKKFVFAEEIHKYTESDVDILREAVWKFRKIFKEVTGGIDCYSVGSTIASVCMHTFRKLFLEHNQLAIVPHGGYRRKEKQSIMQKKLISWISHSENININASGREQKVGPYKLDGYYEDGNNKIGFEYNVSAHN